jgi:ATP-dependent DNA helicase RecG
MDFITQNLYHRPDDTLYKDLRNTMYSQEQLLEKLTRFRQMPSETEWLEFKEAKSDFNFNSLGEYFSALSNESNLKEQHSAWLIFGIKDQPPRAIVGTYYRADPLKLHSLKHEISQQTNGLTLKEIYEVNLPEGRVLMFQIPAAPAGMPTSWKGHFYGRAGESITALPLQKLEMIRKQIVGIDWSAQICPEASINDLDEDAIHTALIKFQRKHSGTRSFADIDQWDPSTFLDKSKLTLKGQITKAAILLLGKPESSYYLSPHPAQITWKLVGEEEAYAHFGPPFLLSVEEVFKHIRNIKFRFQPANQLIPVELTKYDPKIVLEAINNCLAHQDYTQNARIIVTEKIDRLILQNIGSFYDGAVDDYVLRERTPERYRNPFLVQAMVNLDMIDTMGMGIRRMFFEQRKRYFPLPEYNLEDPNHVVLTIYGKLIDENYSRALIEHKNLSIYEVMALDRIQKKQEISKALVQKLRTKKLIEGRYPHVFVSAHVAEAPEERARYIKNKAFDGDHYQQLILKFIDQYKVATRQDIDNLLMDKLPDILEKKQKANKIKNLLGKMRKNGLIRNIGSDKTPQWVKEKSK